MSFLVSDAAASSARALNRLGLSWVNRGGKAVLRRFTGDALTVDVNSLRLTGPVDSWTLLHQLRAGTFERFERDLFLRALRQGMTVLDIGANIGHYTLLASRMVSPTGLVIAFEPDPRSRQSLCVNVDANGADNVRVVAAAASNVRGTSTLYLSGTATHSGLHRSMEDASPRALTVPTIAVDDLELESIHVVKMDIEGEEPRALEGMEATLARSPGAEMFLEFSPAALAAGGCDPNAFARHLLHRFQDVVVIDERRRQVVPFEVPVASERVNLHCSRLAWGNGS